MSNPPTITALYRAMLNSRLLEEKMVTLQRNGLLSTYAGCSGQEVLYAAIGLTLSQTDVYVPYYRDQPCLLLRGYRYLDLIRYWAGDERGNQACGPDLPLCVPIATQCLHAAGVAFALKQQRSQSIAVVTLGDGATSKGDFYEAMNFASVQRLPLVFIINDNGWAISTPLAQQTYESDFTLRAKAMGLTAYRVDGTDPNKVFAALNKAYQDARNYQPVCLHAQTIRLCDHTTADDAKRYKSKSLIHTEKAADPLATILQTLYLTESWTPAKNQALCDELKALIEADIVAFKQTAQRDPATMHLHTLSPQLAPNESS